MQLLLYLLNDKGPFDNDDPFVLAQNMKGNDANEWTAEFENIERYRKNVRRNNIKVIHEIISFSPKDKGSITKDILEDIGRSYMEKRNPKGMFVCVPHVNDDHYHLHVCGSPLEYLNGRSIRQSRKEFREFKYDIQEYQINKYPELTNSIVRHNLGYERRHEQRFIPATVTYEYMVQQIAKECSSMSELLKKLEKYGVEVYYRQGDPYGVILNGQKRRLKNLLLNLPLLKSRNR